MKGVTGKILTVDLSQGVVETQDIGEEIYEMLLSGVGLGAYYLYKNIPAGADPLGPQNILGFTSGLLTGTGAFMAGRWMAVCKSPLTGGWGDSNCGGNLAPAIKQCGVDAIFIKGVAAQPVYLYVDSKGAEIRDAAAYWGMDAIEAEEALIRDHQVKKRPAVAVIGPAGEKRSLISGISNDKGRYAARSGVGAVMGSKKLKALVLAGTKATKVHDSAAVKAISKEYAAKVRKSNLPKMVGGGVFPTMGRVMGAMKNIAPLDGMMTVMLLKKWGTIMNNTVSITNGDAPLKNWAGSDKSLPKSVSRALNPDKMIARETRKYHCHGCVIGCGGVCSIKDLEGGRYEETHKPEYETAMVFGGLLENADLDSIFLINEKLNRAGLDSISTGGTVAFAIECFENGLIGVEDTGGLELRWGDSQAILALVDLIIARRGIGDLLADGVKVAAEKIGKGSEKYAVHAGGQELPMHDPKIDPMLGITYSGDPTPGRHTTSGGMYYSTSFLWEQVSWLPPFGKHPKAVEFLATEEQARANVAQTSFKMLIDGVGACYFAMVTGAQHYRIFDYLNAAAGWNKSPDEYMEVGRRIQTLRQMFNAKQRVDIRQFKMHGRASGHPPLEHGHNKGVNFPVDTMLDLYFQAWGWDGKSGIPTLESFRELGLEDRCGLEYAHGL